MKKLWKRFYSGVPVFWRQVQIVAGTLVGSFTALWITNESLNLQLDPIFITICKYGIAICTVVVGQAQLTVKDGYETV